MDGSVVPFSETDEASSLELWRTGGATRGTVLVQDIASGLDDSNPAGFLRLGSRLLFKAEGPTARAELFAGRAAIPGGKADQGVRDLIAAVRGAQPKGTSTSLTSMLQDASTALPPGSTSRAILPLESFARQVQVQTPGRIDEAAASDRIDFAQDPVRLLSGDFDVAQPSVTRVRAPRRRPVG